MEPTEKKCTWLATTPPCKNPHVEGRNWRRTPKILPDITHGIGNTPLIKLNKLPQVFGIKCDILAKLEYLNPGGSSKDRAALRMIEDAEQQKLITPCCTTLIEACTGDTGVSLAYVASMKGYKCIIVGTEKMSVRKTIYMKSLGAQVVRVPITEKIDSVNGIYGMAFRLSKEIKNAFLLDQFSNPGNPMAFYDSLAQEIYEACDGRVDMIVCSANTGATLTGLGRKFKTISPNTLIVGVDIKGSSLARPECLNKKPKPYEVEGVGNEFVPAVLDYTVVDFWMKVEDAESFRMTRYLNKEEGILCGAVSGCSAVGTMMAAQIMKPCQKVVVILQDGIRNYLHTILDDSWMEARGYFPCCNPKNLEWWDTYVRDLDIEQAVKLASHEKCHRILHLFKTHKQSQFAIVDQCTGNIEGIADEQDLAWKISTGEVGKCDPIVKAVMRVYPYVRSDIATLGLVSRVLEKNPFVVVLVDQGRKLLPYYILTPSDIIKFTINPPKKTTCCCSPKQ